MKGKVQIFFLFFFLAPLAIFGQENSKAFKNAKLMFPSGHSGYITSLSFSPDGSLLASGAGVDEDAVLLWDTKTGNEVDSFKINDGDYVTFSPDGNFLAAGGSGGISLWDITTGKAKSLENKSGWIYSNAFTSDSKYIASGVSGTPRQGYRKIEIRSTTSGQVVELFSGKIEAVCSMAFSPTDSILATSGGIEDPPIVEIWNPWTGHLIDTFTNSGGDLIFGPDGKYLIAGSENRLNIYKMPEGKVIYSGTSVGSPVGFSKEGEIVAYKDNGKTAIFFSLEKKKIDRVLHFDAWYKFAYDPNNDVLASISAKGKIVFRNAHNSNVIYTFGESCRVCGKVKRVKNILMNSDGSTFAVRTADKRFHVWSSESNMFQTLKKLPENWKTLSVNPSPEQSKQIEDQGSFNTISSYSFDPNLKYVAVSAMNHLYLVDADSNQLVRSFVSTSLSPKMAFSANGMKLLVSNTVGITIYNTVGGKELGTLVLLADSNWVFVTPKGLYDGTAEGIKFPYWVKNKRPIFLQNFSKSKYEQGLLRKVLND